MKVSTELTPEHQAVLTVEVDEEQMQKALQKAAQHVSRIRPMPGFRPGKAPYALVERTIGRDLLVDEAVEDLSRTVYTEAVKEANIEPYDIEKFEVVQKDPPIFKYTIGLKPEVTLGDFKSIRLAPTPVEVSDEEVNRVLQRMQLNQATMAPVTRAVQKGDSVVIDVRGGVPDEPPIEEKNMRVIVGQADRPPFPFEEGLIGMTAGDTKEIEYTFPEDYEDESLRGKIAHYTVTVSDVKETQLPDLDDEFVKSISQFETLDQFKGNIRQRLLQQKEQAEEERYADEVIDKLVEQAEIKFPPSLVDHEVDHQLEHLQEDVKRLGLTWPKYLEMIAKTEEQVREEARPRAIRRVKGQLALEQLVDEEKPEVTREELKAEIDRMVESAERAGGNPNVARRSYNAPDARRNIEFALKRAKALEAMVASAKGQTGGRILTPEMVRREAQAAAARDEEPRSSSSGLITDPDEVRAELARGLRTGGRRED